MNSAFAQRWMRDRGELRNHYRFVSWWRLDARSAELWELVSDPTDLVRWFPCAFLEARLDRQSRELQPGLTMSFLTKGWLPYTLRFDAEVERVEYLRACTVTVRGDFEGWLSTEFHADGECCTVRFEWDVVVEQPLVRALSWAFKLVFRANHLWVMYHGWKSLRLELERRRARALGIASPRRAPPGPTFPYGERYTWLRRAARYFAGRSELKMSR